MKSLLSIFSLILLITLFVGCAATTQPFMQQAGQSVDLTKGNFRVVKANAIGTSTGVSILLGIIPITRASDIKAVSSLYAKAGTTEGKAMTMINVMHERTGINLLLFSIKKYRIRADLIEFTQ